MTDERFTRGVLQPDHEMEQRISGWLTDTDLTLPEAQQGLDRLLRDFSQTPQTRRRFLGRWFDRDDGARRRSTEHDHPPDSNRRDRLMFTTTGLVAVFAILAIGVSVVAPTPAPPTAGSGATHVVALDGSGDFDTIAEAVAAATDGDTVLVRPGTYEESVTIDKDITLQGDGPVEEIVLERRDAVIVELRDSPAVVAGVTLRGDGSSQGMRIYGGAPTVRGVIFDHTGKPFGGNDCPSGPGSCGGPSLAISGGTAHVVQNAFLAGGEISIDGNADVAFEQNTLLDGPHLYLSDPGDATIIRGNVIRGTLDRAIGQFGIGAPLIEGNTIEDAGGDGITVGHGASGNIPDGHDPVIRGNDISRSAVGVFVAAGAGPTIAGNRLSSNGTGVGSYSTETILRENLFSGNGVGINISRAATLEGNEITRGEIGMIANLVDADALPHMVNNTICNNEQNVQFGGFEMPDIDDSNEICEDEPTE